MKKLVNRYPKVFALAVLCLLAIAGGIATPFWLYPTETQQLSIQESKDSNSDIQTVPGQLEKGTPTFKTILPSGKAIKDFGGWTRVSPPNRAPVYAYVDKIGAVPIAVSQQPLPKDFLSNVPEKVAELAQVYAADKKLNVGDSIAYLGTSAKGPQSVIVVKGGLLILIKASAVIPNSEWEKYIKSLS